MAIADHVERLWHGVQVWNEWRRMLPSGRPDLSREHLRERLDRGHAMPERNEDACQLSRPRSEVDDVERLVADEPADCFVRVAGPAAVVRVGDLREGRRRPATLFIAVHDHA